MGAAIRVRYGNESSEASVERPIAAGQGRAFKAGWKVVRIWECQLVRRGQARVVGRIRKAMSNK
jgi:G:T-mismatch repair DNA endonuclease (very short patch repair protein)